MTQIVNWASIAAILIISYTIQIHAKVSTEQAHLSAMQRHRNLHAHHHDRHKSQFAAELHHKLQQTPQLQHRQPRLGTFNSSSTDSEVLTMHNRTPPSLAMQPMQQRSTRLRRLSARDYYNNNVMQRRLHNHRGNSEWNYHTYNVHSNTYESPTGASGPGAVKIGSSGKGDDNTDDVEFISQTGTGVVSPDWKYNRREIGYMPPHTTVAPPTHPPPPLVPARRGYVTAAPPSLNSDLPGTTDEPKATNIDAKEMEKRHICVQQRTITMPVKTTEVYARPIWKHVNTPCSAVQVQTQHPNQMCTRVQLVHEQTFRDVIRHKAAQQVTYDCCNGWEREGPHSDACLKPVCTKPCQNSGTCSAPDVCSCPVGFTGQFCEHDINECKEEKPCDQTCINTVGSYFCKCREGFILQPDQQSCKKNALQDDDAFEARDLENEIESSDNEDITARLQKIERSLANERVHTNELQKSLTATYNVVDTLKSRLNTIEKQQQDLNRLQSNLYATESRTNKLEGMLNLLMKCRNGPNAYCP
ncbi:uncharacterized protein LOC128861319 [Anastrepha ludens]|uniref:uncharacterized protein LOC128861319 n=1 Tax=Anastrepha ludens TaxID=28586 RepID=UPI0023AEAC19|nr:uncharacterized protein LOC128861319 [Anastrepha ludens]XP_053955342.1 uncharacterized protein LOC128861319 [Anastrepha ludens]XP_053955343.1 uncharacterized protein LOC128861319 [Anastrepha ludens]XP_053955344.1 uncharacterized protein LOC128861319 [Anastrepha ludens]XP_053955345.1 uncharacterized protein LOC128861319 [Anastrepha ludens]